MEALLPKAHIILGVIALLVYLVRGIMMIAGSSDSRAMLTIASFTTLLLFGSGIYIGFALKLSFAGGFVGTKIIGLLLFVGFGVIALKQGLSKPVAITLWLLGLAAFVYTYLIATHKIAPFFS